MSLETKIEKLTAAVELLTAKIETLATQAQPAPAPEQVQAPEVEKVEKPKVEKKAAKVEAEPAQEPAQEVVTEQELMDLCMSIVRRDRALKDTIKATIERHGGKVVAEVDPSKYAELKAELEAL